MARRDCCHHPLQPLCRAEPLCVRQPRVSSEPMADFAALISALAECDDRDRTALEHIARALCEAGHIPTIRQGSDAAEMGFREAANLLIGANGADTSKEAGRAVEEYRSLVPGVSLYGDVGEPWGFEPWTFIDEASTFGEALEKLIENASAILLSLSAYVPDTPGEDAPEARQALATDHQARLIVEFSRYPAQAEIRVERFLAGRTDMDYERIFSVDLGLVDRGFYRRGTPHRYVTVAVDLQTLVELYLAIVGEGGMPTV